MTQSSELQSGPPASSSDVAQLRAVLARAVARICPSWLFDQRDDLVQVAVMRVMDIQSKSEGNRELSTSYLYKVAYSTLVDEIRRSRRRREVALKPDDDSVEHAVTTEDPEQRAAAGEIGRGIRECLEAMKQERRLAVALHLQGHSVPDAARLLGWMPKRTENLVYRGLADLRRCLSSKGLEP